MIRATGRVPVKLELAPGTSLRTAARAFFDLNKTWPDEVENTATGEGMAVVGGCEMCGQAILEGDDYASDAEDGGHYCVTCAIGDTPTPAVMP